jgi:hypothetical protein
MSYLKVSGIRRILGAMLVPLLVASQAIGGNSPDQAQTQTKSKGTVRFNSVPGCHVCNHLASFPQLLHRSASSTILG